MGNYVFAPGCALYLYKPQTVERFLSWLNRDAQTDADRIPLHLTCCHNEPQCPQGSTLITVCTGCDRRFRKRYAGITTVSIWELLADDDSFPLPDHGGVRMALHDTCTARKEERIHTAVRKVLKRMHIEVVEPGNNRTESVCCGDRYYGKMPDDEVFAKMRERAEQMACDDVAVYCVACSKSMAIGGKTPHYLPDLLFCEPTTAQQADPVAWRASIMAMREAR